VTGTLVAQAEDSARESPVRDDLMPDGNDDDLKPGDNHDDSGKLKSKSEGASAT